MSTVVFLPSGRFWRQELSMFGFCIASSAAAGLIFFLLERLLPAGITRGWLIAIGGLAGILWSHFVDLPLKAWSQDR